MDLTKMFEMQKELGQVGLFNYRKPDRFNRLILALLVEVGECANELPEVFKYWSLKKNNYETALIEFVDGIHFILELGLDKEFTNVTPKAIKAPTLEQQFNRIFDSVSQFYFFPSLNHYQRVWDLYLGLGEMLGFSGEEIQKAYVDKNQVNVQRQEDGY